MEKRRKTPTSPFLSKKKARPLLAAIEVPDPRLEPTQPKDEGEETLSEKPTHARDVILQRKAELIAVEMIRDGGNPTKKTIVARLEKLSIAKGVSYERLTRLVRVTWKTSP